MSKSYKGKEREGEIITFFYLIFGNRVHEGLNQDDARKEAYDAVTLRYGISQGRLLNIISARKCSQNANRVAFRESARTLISELNVVNKGLCAHKERNDKLIALLKECINDR